MKAPTKEEQIEEILKNFNFELVLKTINKMKWHPYKSTERVSTYSLMEIAREGLEKAYALSVGNEGNPAISSARFIAICNYFPEDDTRMLDLHYVVAEWSTDYMFE